MCDTSFVRIFYSIHKAMTMTTMTTTTIIVLEEKKKMDKNFTADAKQRNEKKQSALWLIGLRLRIPLSNFGHLIIWIHKSISSLKSQMKIISPNSSHIFSVDFCGLRWMYNTFDFVRFSHSCAKPFVPNPILFVRQLHTNAQIQSQTGKTYRLSLSGAGAPHAKMHKHQIPYSLRLFYIQCVIWNAYTRNVAHQYICPHRTLIFYFFFSYFLCGSFHTRKKREKHIQLLHLRAAYFVSRTTMTGCVWQLTCAQVIRVSSMPIHNTTASECVRDTSKCRRVRWRRSQRHRPYGENKMKFRRHSVRSVCENRNCGVWIVEKND